MLVIVRVFSQSTGPRSALSSIRDSAITATTTYAGKMRRNRFQK